MKIPIFLCFISFSAFCQDSLHHYLADTVSITPDGAKRSIRSLPYYTVPVTDRRLREPSMGMSILNTLRGQAPGLLLTQQFITGDPFDVTAFLVIDGAPVNATMAGLSSLNTFDYDNPTIISGNATTYYGMYGTGNGVLLKSLTGEGATRGKFSFNTFNTTGWATGDDNYHDGQSLTSNSLSYSKDFGAVDLRVSGNYTGGGQTDHDAIGPRESTIKNLTFKINTGWNISSKLRSRFIIEKNSNNRDSEVHRFTPDPQDKAKYDYGSSRANLSLNYDATSWLGFSSRLQKSWVDNDYQDPRYPYSPIMPLSHDRNLVNLFTNFDKHITDNIAISASTGFQRDKATGSFPYYINSQMNTVGFRFKDQLFVDGSLRFDNSDIDPEKNNKKTWSVGTGWVFSDLMKANSNSFYGKLRASVGRYSYTTIPYYPQVALTNGRFIENMVDNSREYYRYDVGTDLMFWKGRIQLSANYLRLATTLGSSYKSVEAGFATVTILDRTRYITDMQQVAIGAYLTGEKSAFTKLTLTTIQARRQSPPDRSTKTTEGQPFFIDLLQTMTYDRIVLNLLLEAYSFSQTETIGGIRQLSVGYSVMHGFAERRSVNPAMISVIFRNFMSSDETVYVTNGMAKSISIGFTVNF